MLADVDGLPRPVILAVALFGLLFLGGGVYLFISSPFTGTEIIAPAELPGMTAVVADYQGPLPGLEPARKRVEQELVKSGLDGGEPITIYPDSPLFMRPIAVTCRLGYLLVISRQAAGLRAPVRLEVVKPGKRLIVRVKGKGNFTGNKAYKAALRFLRPLGLRPANGERYEVKRRLPGGDVVEHWVPVE